MPVKEDYINELARRYGDSPEIKELRRRYATPEKSQVAVMEDEPDVGERGPYTTWDKLEQMGRPRRESHFVTGWPSLGGAFGGGITMPKPPDLNTLLTNVQKEIDSGMYKDFDPEGSGYDYITAMKNGIVPVMADDGKWHWPSRVGTGADEGRILKGKGHPTFYLTEQGEKEAGYQIYQGVGGNYWSRPMDEPPALEEIVPSEQGESKLGDLLKNKDIPSPNRMSNFYHRPPEVIEEELRPVVEAWKREHELNPSMANKIVYSADFFGLGDWLSRHGIHPGEFLTKVLTGTDVSGYRAAERKAIREIMANAELKDKLIYGVGKIPEVLAEFAIPAGKVAKATKWMKPATKLGKIGKGVIGGGLTFAGQEAMQAPREGETLAGRIGSTADALSTGSLVGLLGGAFPEKPVTALGKTVKAAETPIMIGGFGAKTYAETGDWDATIEAMLTVAGFKALGLAGAAGRYFKARAAREAKTKDFMRSLEEMRHDSQWAENYYNEHGRLPQDLINKYKQGAEQMSGRAGNQLALPEPPPGGPTIGPPVTQGGAQGATQRARSILSKVTPDKDGWRSMRVTNRQEGEQLQNDLAKLAQDNNVNVEVKVEKVGPNWTLRARDIETPPEAERPLQTAAEKAKQGPKAGRLKTAAEVAMDRTTPSAMERGAIEMPTMADDMRGRTTSALKQIVKRSKDQEKVKAAQAELDRRETKLYVEEPIEKKTGSLKAAQKQRAKKQPPQEPEGGVVARSQPKPKPVPEVSGKLVPWKERGVLYTERPPAEKGGDYSEEAMNARTLRNRRGETEPPKVKKYPIGTYGTDSAGDLMQLQEFDIDDPKLVFPEGEPKNQTVDKYAQWIQEGNEPPPMDGVETESGKIKISEGHHRRAAIRQTGGKKVKVWVSLTQTETKRREDGSTYTVSKGIPTPKDKEPQPKPAPEVKPPAAQQPAEAPAVIEPDKEAKPQEKAGDEVKSSNKTEIDADSDKLRTIRDSSDSSAMQRTAAADELMLRHGPEVVEPDKVKSIPPVKPGDSKNALKVIGTHAATGSNYAAINDSIYVSESGDAVATDAARMIIVPDAEKYVGKLEGGKTYVLSSKNEATKSELEGKFPKYEDMIPKDTKTVGTTDRNTTNRIIGILDSTQKINRANTKKANPLGAKIGEQLINARYLSEGLTALQKLGADKISWGTEEAEKPLLLEGKDESGKVVGKVVIMPVSEPDEARNFDVTDHVTGKGKQRYRGKAAIPGKEDLAEVRRLAAKALKGLSAAATLASKTPYMRQSVDVLKDLAPKFGKKLGDTFFQVTDMEKDLVGEWEYARLGAMGKLQKEDWQNFRLAARHMAKPANKQVTEAVNQWWSLYSRMGDMKENVGLPRGDGKGAFQKKGNDYPLYLSKEARKEISRETGPIYDKMVQWAAEDMQKRGIEYGGTEGIRNKTKDWSGDEYIKQAQSFLRDSRKYDTQGVEMKQIYDALNNATTPAPTATGQKPWQYRRAFEWPDEFLEPDPHKTLERFIQSSARRVAEATYWGPESKKLQSIVKAGMDETGAQAKNKGQNIDGKVKLFAETARHILGQESNISGLKTDVDSTTKALTRGARATTGALQLFGVEAPVRNIIWGQMVSMNRFGVLRSNAHFLWTLFGDRDRIREAQKAGALEHSGVQHLFAEGIWPGVVKATSGPMKLAEILLRTSASHAGTASWSRMIARCHQKPNDRLRSVLLRELTVRDVGFSKKDVERMIKTGKITEADRRKMMRGAVNVSQFSADAKDIPKSWSSEFGRFFTQFWSMAYKHTQNTIGYSLKEMGHGRFMPIARLAIAAMFAGMGVDFVYKVCRGEKPDKRDLNKFDKWLRRVGNAGGFIEKPLNTILGSGPYTSVIQTLAPASVGTADQILTAAKNAYRAYMLSDDKKKRKRANRQALRTTSVGRTVVGVKERYQQGKGVLQDQMGIKPDKKAVSELYRRKLTNLYRFEADQSKINKLDQWATGYEVDTVVEKEAAMAQVRKDLYEEHWLAWQNNDMKKMQSLRRRIIKMGGSEDDIVDSINRRRKGELKYAQ